MSAYSSPAAEYVKALVKELERRHRARLWFERFLWLGVYAVFSLPMFTGVLNNAPL